MHDQAYGSGGPVPIKMRLSAYLGQEAEWRDEKAVEYPDDLRNRRSADALRGLAAHIDQLPEDEPNVRVLEALQERYHLGLFAPGDEGKRLITKLGFHEPVDDYDAVLRRLVEAEVDEAFDQQLEEGRR